MRPRPTLPTAPLLKTAALLAAAALAWVSASVAAGVIEARSSQAVSAALAEAGHDWAEVHTDGLEVHLGGIAPSEALRFNALAVSARQVDAARVIDGTVVAAAQPVAPPRFSVEILRNDDGIQMIGLVPAALDRGALLEEVRRLVGGVEVTEFLESADHPVPPLWAPSLDFALDALAGLPRSRISVGAGQVAIEAIGESREHKARLEALLARRAPDGVRVALDISAPRPVITPFTLRFVADDAGGRFDACSADSPAGRDRILAAARDAGMQGKGACTLGLGVPSPDWADAVAMALGAVADLGGGTLVFSDADIALASPPGADPARFDRVVGALESNLPATFALAATLRPAPDAEGAGPPPPVFTATRDPEGQVRLTGRLPNAVVHQTVESFARARFGMEAVYMAARQQGAGLPEDWPLRVLAGLAALAEIDHGTVRVEAARLSVEGVSGNAEARAEIARLLADKLGEGAEVGLAVRYDERLDPLADIPTPEDCLRRIDLILAERKITFAPGSTEIEGESAEVMDEIAEVFRECRKAEMAIEIAGHTDSQGREEMNLALSEARAAAVLEALAARRAPVAGVTSKGYGETTPIADNATEEGREANRRIEFRLRPDEPPAVAQVEGAEVSGAEPEPEADAAASDDAAEGDE